MLKYFCIKIHVHITILNKAEKACMKDELHQRSKVTLIHALLQTEIRLVMGSVSVNIGIPWGISINIFQLIPILIPSNFN